MAPRAQLQLILESIIPRVYFQPPTNVQMEYPAIVYERIRARSSFADNDPYHITKQYQITMITRNPDETAWAAISQLSTCIHERFYVADNLNHDVFTLYF